jgi:hypothetical protein
VAVSVCLKEGEKEEEGENMPTMMTLAGGHSRRRAGMRLFFCFFSTCAALSLPFGHPLMLFFLSRS